MFLFQYSHKFASKMIEESADTAAGGNSKLSVIVRCPICDYAATASFVPAVGKKVGYFSPSNFSRHVRHSHMSSEENPKKQGKRMSTTSTSKPAKGAKPQKRPRNRTIDSESSESEDDMVRQEISKNYLHESDDLVDEDFDEHLHSDCDAERLPIQQRSSGTLTQPSTSAQPSSLRQSGASAKPKRELRSRINRNGKK